MGNSPLTLKKSLLVIAGIAVIAFAIHIFLSWQREARRAERIRLEMVPDQFEVKKILYANSGCTGIGLSGGDDCSGVIMYKLPEKSAQEIIKNGIKFFQALSQKFAIEDWSNFKEWQTTPIPPTSDWVWNSEIAGPSYPHTLSQFLCPYALPTEIEPEIETNTNSFISTPGGYFTRDRYGVMIVRPVEKRIVYFYRN